MAGAGSRRVLVAWVGTLEHPDSASKLVVQVPSHAAVEIGPAAVATRTCWPVSLAGAGSEADHGGVPSTAGPVTPVLLARRDPCRAEQNRDKIVIRERQDKDSAFHAS